MAVLPRKLQDVGAKVGRAIDHFQTLNREISSFLGSGPYEIVSNFDAQKRTYTYRVKVLNEVPILVRILTGEVLAHFRSALDHLAWQLALLSGPNPAASTEFPIFSTSAAYTKARTKKIGSLPVHAQVIIDRLQPCVSKRPDDDLLWVLHRLANDDKHRLPHLMAAAPGGIAAGPSRGRSMEIAVRVGPLNDQAEIGSVTFMNPADTDMEVQTNIVFDLAFPSDSAAKGRMVRPELARLGQRVEEVVREFVTFF